MCILSFRGDTYLGARLFLRADLLRRLVHGVLVRHGAGLDSQRRGGAEVGAGGGLGEECAEHFW